jgi:hypothetical protein
MPERRNRRNEQFNPIEVSVQYSPSPNRNSSFISNSAHDKSVSFKDNVEVKINDSQVNSRRSRLDRSSAKKRVEAQNQSNRSTTFKHSPLKVTFNPSKKHLENRPETSHFGGLDSSIQLEV